MNRRLFMLGAATVPFIPAAAVAKTRKINELIVHCTATPLGWNDHMTATEITQRLREIHLQRGWSDIGYHYVIHRDGVIAKGRPVEQAGAHVGGRNANTIGIALVGGKGSHPDDKFEDHYTDKQKIALISAITTFNLPTTGHNDYAVKACPGFRVAQFMKEYNL